MKKLTKEDLEKIKQETIEANKLREGGNTVEITVHMGTCGIAAGAEEVYNSLREEIERSGRQDISVVVTGCAGMC
ncbi:MAG: (2Fe-2S) ferredoxin domain-containing protein, partial [Deltaproteobacteria bacterium]